MASGRADRNAAGGHRRRGGIPPSPRQADPLRFDVMAAELKPYPRYRDSGVEWLEAVPAHWEVRRAKHVFRRIVGGSTPSSSDSRYWGNAHVWVTPADVSRSTRIRGSQRQLTQEGLRSCSAELLPAGSIVVTSRAPVGNVALAEVPFCTNQGCKALVPKHGQIDSAFGFNLLHVLQAELQSLAKGTTFTEVSGSIVGDVRLPLPPLSEQTAIVRFLDHAGRRIRRYTRAKEKLIGLLEEHEQAVIHEAVTGQIDARTGRPYPAYRDSGTEWLGRVPRHWERTRLKTLLRPVDRRSVDGQETLLSLRRDHGVVIYAEHFSHPPQSSSLVGFKLVEAGQLVVNRLQANNGLVFCSALDGAVSPDYSVFEKKKKYPIHIRFLSDVLRTPMVRAHFWRRSTGLGTGSAGFLRLYDDQFLSTVVAVPPWTEQAAIMEFVDQTLGSTQAAVACARREVERLGEYRKRLIADVVTGKVDVREATAGLPEPDPLAEEEDTDGDSHRQTGSEASGDAKDGGPPPHVVDTKRSGAVAGELRAEGK